MARRGPGRAGRGGRGGADHGGGGAHAPRGQSRQPAAGPRGDTRMSGFEMLFGIVPVLVIAIFVIGSSVRILRDYERAVIFRFGRRANAVINPGGDGSGPGLLLLIPFVDKMGKVSRRTTTMGVPP